MLRISIPQACYERRENMTLLKTGAYNKSVAGSITNFAGMTGRQLAFCFSKYQEQQLCGRYLHSPLNRPDETVSPEVLLMNIPGWKKHLAILLICFPGMPGGYIISPEKKYNFQNPEIASIPLTAIAFQDSLKLTDDYTAKAGCDEVECDNKAERSVSATKYIPNATITFANSLLQFLSRFLAPRKITNPPKNRRV